MKKWILSFAAALALTLGAGCSTAEPEKKQELQITQVSAIDVLLAGKYDGVISAGELRKYGNLGLGTVDHLDGEIILLDGTGYHIRADGKVYPLPDDTMISFAAAVPFKPDHLTRIGKYSTMEEFLKLADIIQPNQKIPVAVRIYGTFRTVKIRTLQRQEKPYPPPARVVEQQAEFTFENTEGWLIGFRMPDSMKTAKVPAWHLHFLSADKKSGGHVLEFQMEESEMESAGVYDFRMILPKDPSEDSENTEPAS